MFTFSRYSVVFVLFVAGISVGSDMHVAMNCNSWQLKWEQTPGNETSYSQGTVPCSVPTVQ